MSNIPSEIYAIILDYIEYPYKFSLSCKLFNELVRKNVVPSDEQIIYSFKRKYPLSTIKQIISNTKSNLAVKDNFPINICVLYNWIDAIKLLISDDRVDPSNAINRAMRMGHFDITSLLINHPKLKEVDLYNAISFGHYKLVKHFLNHPKVTISTQLLRDAVINSQYKIVELLLSHPKIDPNDYQLIYYAVITNKPEILKLLLSDVRIKVNDVSVLLQFAINHGYHDIIALLM